MPEKYDYSGTNAHLEEVKGQHDGCFHEELGSVRGLVDLTKTLEQQGLVSANTAKKVYRSLDKAISALPSVQTPEAQRVARVQIAKAAKRLSKAT